MNETRDTRDTFVSNSQGDNIETDNSKILNSGVFNAINTTSTIEHEKIEPASAELKRASNQSPGATNQKLDLPHVEQNGVLAQSIIM